MISKRFSPFVAALSIVGCAQLSSIAKTDFNEVGEQMAGMLMNSHYARLPFDEDLSQTIFEVYLNQLDPRHLYFTEEDIDGFREKYETRLHRLLTDKKSMVPATEIHELYQERLMQRMDLAKKILEEENFDFTSDKEVMRSREDAPWPKDEAAAVELWRRQIESALLAEEMRRDTIRQLAEDQGKEDPLADELSPKKKVLQRYERIKNEAKDLDEEDIANSFLSAVALAHDPHTDYQSARETDRFKSAMANSLVGIGALLRSEDDGATRIVGIVVGGPAEKQGELQLDDRIIGVGPLADGDMEDIMFRKIDHVVDLIRGDIGTKVALKVEPAGAAAGVTKIIVIDRGKVDLKDEAATGEIINMKGDDGEIAKIGWITLPSFYIDFQDGDPSVAFDVRLLLERMVKEEIKGLVVDLRGNGGGSLDEVMKMTSYFIGEGPVVQIKDTFGRTMQREASRGATKKPIYDGPMVVITDKTSASASEILAGALQDYNRAVIVGDRSSFGKGTVQQPVSIGQFLNIFQDSRRAGQLKLTIQKFYRVAGSSTQLKGVVPDIVLPSVLDSIEIGEEYLDHALEHDRIAPAKKFTPADRELLQVDTLAGKSLARVKSSQDFKYVMSDVERRKKEIADNVLSLNKEKREAEIEESYQRNKARKEEMRERFAKIEAADKDIFEFFRLGLEDVDREELEKVDLEKDKEKHMRVAKEKLDDLDDNPEYPNGMGPTKRESLNIIRDMIQMDAKAKELAEVKGDEESALKN